MKRHHSLITSKGFSLTELVIVIIISGIVAAILTPVITQPFQSYIDLSRRAALVYSAESALRRMQRDIRRSLPNSIRINATGTAMELISTLEGARYRAMPPPGDPDRRLTFVNPDAEFDILGNFSTDTFTNAATISRLAIYNIGAVDASIPPQPIPGANAYAPADVAGRNVITPAGVTISIANDPVNANEDHVSIAGGFAFSFASPLQRMYLIDTAVVYECRNDQLLRHTNYNFTNNAVPAVPGGNTAIMADNLAPGACAFRYNPGTSQRAGVVTLDLSIADLASSEIIRLLHQVHVNNAP